MQKVDFKKELKSLYNPSAKIVSTVDVPKMNFLMIDGEGDPNKAKSFGDAVEALYSVSYTLKFMVKKGDMEIDYGVMPLEALWWADDMESFRQGRKDQWKWTVMIMQPEFITAAMVDETVASVKAKKNPVALDLLRFESFVEGRAAQIMHTGPFSEEGPNIEKVHASIAGHGCRLAGMHHEIYLSDIRRAAPEKWKTIIRQPMI